MKTTNPWILPDGIEEVLPPDAARLEELRRALLDAYSCWGYDLVFPPLVEFKESLLTGVGTDLGGQTLGMTDRISGRTLGVRADISPQAARIDAHSLGRAQPCRLCYCGSVLKAAPEGPLRSRSPIQIGAELFGVDELSADAEVVRLMLESLKIAGVEDITLDLGNVTIFTWVEDRVRAEVGDSGELFNLIQDKRLPELDAWIAASELSRTTADMVARLPRLSGDIEVLSQARRLFADAPAVLGALDELRQLAEIIGAEYPEVRLFFDLGELRGANYHTGVVFAAYTPGYGSMLANGGRYDEVGRAFGRARPATGFSTDLRTLLHIGNFRIAERELVLAPDDRDPELQRIILELREQGQRVVTSFQPLDTERARANGASHILTRNDGNWRLQPLEED